MNAHIDYWKECIANDAEECDLTLTEDQLGCIAEAVANGHEHYGMAFYEPPWTDRISVIESEAAAKLKRLQDEFDTYQANAEKAVKIALRVHDDTPVTIGEYGEVLAHDGRTRQIQ